VAVGITWAGAIGGRGSGDPGRGGVIRGFVVSRPSGLFTSRGDLRGLGVDRDKLRSSDWIQL